jgi:hypothetical protein
MVGWILSSLKGIVVAACFYCLIVRLPLSTCDKPNFRKYVNLPKISSNTLIKYMHRLTRAVEAKVSDCLSEKFPIVFDGWTLKGTSTHYVCVLAQVIGEV